MRHRFIRIAAMLGCVAATPALAQGNAEAEASATAFAADYAAGLPDFIIDTAAGCYVAIVDGLDAEDQAIVAAEADFISGINALAAAKPELPETLFPALDNCGNTVTSAELMWEWVVDEALPGASEAEQVALGSCVVGAIDRLTLDAKRGITRFRYGNFHQAIEAMLFERPDLGGNIVEDMAACGITVEARRPPLSAG